MYMACFVNTVKHKIILKYIQKFSSHLTENTTRLQYKDQPATGGYTRSSFVTLLSRRAQSGRWSSFEKRVWFTESHIVLIISFLLVLFTHFIVDIK